jgi:hypothetical protein
VRRDSATIGSDYGVVDFNAVRPWRDSILGGDFNTLSTDLVVHFDRHAGQTNHRLPEFSTNVTPVTSARNAGGEDQYVYFWRTASGTFAARPAVACLPTAETRYGSTHDVYAHTSVEELRPSQSFKPAAPCPLFPQLRTQRWSIASVSESRPPRSAFPSGADLWWGCL